MKKVLCLCLLVSLVGCTNANWKQVTTIGSPAHILCYSGGKVVLDTHSTGKILTEKQSDGWYFEDATTHKLIRVNAQCIIEN